MEPPGKIEKPASLHGRLFSRFGWIAVISLLLAFSAQADAKPPIVHLEKSQKYPGLLLIPHEFISPQSAAGAPMARALLYQGQNDLNISWNSFWEDGSYALYFNAEQVYLISGHNNPTPNFLFWLAPVTAEQYQALKNYLAKPVARPLEKADGYLWFTPPLSDGHWSKNHEAVEPKLGHEEVFYRNTIALLRLLNKQLPKEVAPLPLPKSKRDLAAKIHVVRVLEDLE